jgi:exonuclease-1
MVVTVVFDGAALPMKRGTESDRAKTRQTAFQKALELENSGNKALAGSFFSRSIDVTPEMAFEVSEAIKKLGVGVIVAPYEADAQLAYLSMNNVVDIVITEDSDLLVYGCQRVLYKLDFKTEQGKEILRQDIYRCPGFDRLSDDTFLLTCILSGCDYLPALDKFGIRSALSIGTKAEGLLSRQNNLTVDSETFLLKVVLLIRLSGITDEALDNGFVFLLQRAFQTFRHQTIFCTEEQTLKPLTPIVSDIPDRAFLGEIYPPDIAIKVVNCLIHPESKTEFVPLVQSLPDPTSTVPKKKAITKSFPTKAVVPKPSGGTLLDCWRYHVDVSRDTLRTFVDPVIELDEDDDSHGTPQEVDLVDISDSESNRFVNSLERFAAANNVTSRKRSREDDIENFALDNYRNST